MTRAKCETQFFMALLCVIFAGGPAALAAADQPKYIDDRAMRRAIEARANALAEADKTVANDVLQSYLIDRPTFAGKAPKPFTLIKAGEDLYDTVDDGVLIISRMYLCGRCDNLHANNASGFVISKDGLAITNHHVIENTDVMTQTFVATTRSGKVYPIVEVLASSDDDDLALVRLDVGSDELAALPVARSARVGETVHVVSHPSSRFFEYSRGYVNRFLLSPRNNNTPRISVSSHYGGGSSGGPIFNDQGQVVAVVSEAEVVRDRKIVFYDAVPYSAILALFDPDAAAED